jgi:MbtH protein
MSVEDNQVGTANEVVINDEEQYSIWPVGKALPLGWKSVGKQGCKASCLEYTKKVWLDMRPFSLRKQTSLASSVLESSSTFGASVFFGN